MSYNIKDDVVVKDTSNYISDNSNDAKNSINSSLEKLPNSSVIKETNSFKGKGSLLELSWKTYRIIAFILFVLSFIVMKLFYDYIDKKINDKEIMELLKIVSFFFIINFGIFLFMNVYYKYRKEVKGSKGASGNKGIRGDQGGSSYCNICNDKTGTMNRPKKIRQKEKVVRNVVIDFDKVNSDNRGWTPLNTKYRDTYGGNENLTIINPRKLGAGCASSQCTQNGDSVKHRYRNSETHKPIIGATLNYNKKNGNIYTLQYYVDKNKKHNPNKYNIGLFGGSDGKFGREDNFGTAAEFKCPPNAAINKVDVVDNGKNIKGLKFYCSDIVSGKPKKALDENGQLRYGVSFGKEYDPNVSTYHKSSIGCNAIPITRQNEGESSSIKSFYPTFISNVGSDYDSKNIKNLHFGQCSYYKDFVTNESESPSPTTNT